MKTFRQTLANAKVFYRIYPLHHECLRSIKINDSQEIIQVLKSNSKHEEIWRQFVTDGIFDNMSQETLYFKVMENVIESIFQGQNGIVLAFGQTGSGKSSTISGLNFLYQERGMVPRIIEQIFDMKEKMPKKVYTDIHLSYIEVLSDSQIRDLLKSYPACIDKLKLLKGVTKIRVASDLDALQHIFKGEGRKEFTSDTKYASHLGTSIITFHVTVRDMDKNESFYEESKLHILDMAGCDFCGNISAKFKESKYIGSANFSKSFIEHFLILLRENEIELTKVKKRTNVIVKYLGDTLNRKSILRFIGHLKVEDSNIPLTLSMLKFGQAMRDMKSQIISISSDDNNVVDTKILQAKLDEIYEREIIFDMIQNRNGTAQCQDKMEQVLRLIEKYMKNEIDETHILYLTDARTVVKLLKEKIKKCPVEEEDSVITAEFYQRTEKSDLKRNSLKSSSVTMPKMSSKSSDAGKAQLNNEKEKFTSQMKSHKGDSSETDKQSLTRRGKMSSVSLSGQRRSSLLGKKKSGLVDSLGSVDKSSKKMPIEPQQNSSLLSTVNLILPDVIPEHKEALKEYISSDKTLYKTTLDTYKQTESDAKNVSQVYMKEIIKLQTLLELLDLRKTEFLQSKLVQKMSTEGGIDLENKCKDNLEKAKYDVKNQQEIVSNLQTELKIALNSCQLLKKDIKEEFEEFCKEKYNISVPYLEDINETIFDDEVIMEDIAEILDQNETMNQSNQESIRAEMYEELKSLTVKEIKKKAQYLKATTKWRGAHL